MGAEGILLGMGNFRISCSHKRVAMVWTLARGQGEVGAEKFLSWEYTGVRGGIQDPGRGSLIECGELKIYK